MSAGPRAAERAIQSWRDLPSTPDGLAATYRGRSERAYYPHRYALQITADSPHWGGSSGASLTEGISWGKPMVASTRVDCRCDATIALPLLVQALSEQRVSRRRRPFSALFTGGGA